MVFPPFGVFCILLKKYNIRTKLRIVVNDWVGPRSRHVLRTEHLTASKTYTYLNVSIEWKRIFFSLEARKSLMVTHYHQHAVLSKLLQLHTRCRILRVKPGGSIFFCPGSFIYWASKGMVHGDYPIHHNDTGKLFFPSNRGTIFYYAIWRLCLFEIYCFASKIFYINRKKIQSQNKISPSIQMNILKMNYH